MRTFFEKPYPLCRRARFLEKRNTQKKTEMDNYGIDDARWTRLETWGRDFLAKRSCDISRQDMAELMKLFKETAKEVNVMSAIEWQAIQEACEATREETREVTRREALEEAARVIAMKSLAIGLDPIKVAEATGLSFDELQKLQIPAVS